jgi:hypothetical protein
MREDRVLVAIALLACTGMSVSCQKGGGNAASQQSTAATATDSAVRAYLADSLVPFIEKVAQGTCNLERNLNPPNPPVPRPDATNQGWRFCEPPPHGGGGDNYTPPPPPPPR